MEGLRCIVLMLMMHFGARTTDNDNNLSLSFSLQKGLLTFPYKCSLQYEWSFCYRVTIRIILFILSFYQLKIMWPRIILRPHILCLLLGNTRCSHYFTSFCKVLKYFLHLICELRKGTCCWQPVKLRSHCCGKCTDSIWPFDISSCYTTAVPVVQS